MAPRITASSESKRLRNAFLSDLEREGDRIVKRLTEQFLRDLTSQGEGIVKDLSTGLGQGVEGIAPAASLARLLGGAITLAISRPRTTKSTRETARSKDTEQLFRVSHRQSLAEAGLELNKGEKNL